MSPSLVNQRNSEVGAGANPDARNANLSFSILISGADPGFPVGGAPTPPREGANKFSQVLHEIKKILVRRGRRVPPYDPPLNLLKSA